MLHQTIITLLSIVVVWQVIGLVTAIIERRMMTCPGCGRKDALCRTSGDTPGTPPGAVWPAEFRCRHCGYLIR